MMSGHGRWIGRQSFDKHRRLRRKRLARTGRARAHQAVYVSAEVVSEWKKGSSITWKGTWQGKPHEDRGTILDLQEGRLIQYSHFSPLSGLADVPGNYHTVTVQLSPEGEEEGTRVSLAQDNNPDEEAREHSEKNWALM